jgi:hypothetical protein
MDAISKIKSIVDKTSEIDYINSGGCACFALYLSAYLRKVGVKHTIVVFDRSTQGVKEKVDHIRKTKSESKGDGRKSFAHVMVRVNGKYIDGENVFETIPSYWCANYGYLKCLRFHELVHSVRWGRWSDWYDRKSNLQIKKIIKQVHNEILEEYY